MVRGLGFLAALESPGPQLSLAVRTSIMLRVGVAVPVVLEAVDLHTTTVNLATVA